MLRFPLLFSRLLVRFVRLQGYKAKVTMDTFVEMAQDAADPVIMGTEQAKVGLTRIHCQAANQTQKHQNA